MTLMIPLRVQSESVDSLKTVSEYVLKKKQKIEEAVAKAKKYKDKVEKYKVKFAAPNMYEIFSAYEPVCNMVTGY